MTRLHGTLVVAFLAAALISPPAATALTEEVRAVGAEAGGVTEAATEALPSLPVPVEPPPAPKAPPPPASSPTPPAAPSAPSAPDPPAADPAGGAEEVIAPSSSTTESGPSASPAFGVVAEPGASPDAGKPGQRSIGPAETPSMRRWRAYVWPAIALRVEEAMAPLLTRLDGFVDVAVLPDVLETFTSSALSGSVGLAGPPLRVESPSGEPRPSSGPALPEGEMGLLAILLVALLTAMGLVALARLVVGEDLFERRYWRGHRG